MTLLSHRLLSVSVLAFTILLSVVHGAQKKSAVLFPRADEPKGTAPAPPPRGNQPPGSVPVPDRSGAEIIGGPIVDEGYTGLRQLVDVNGDHRLDYCRFVGDPPDIFLSCQLGVAKDWFSLEPHGFNSMKGIDRGYENMPRALLDVNNDQRADFCRYIGEADNIRLMCDLATSTGFATEQYSDPNDYLAKGFTRALRIAPDGTALSYVRNSTTGSWQAWGTDSNGYDWVLKGDASKTPDRNAGANQFFYNTGMRLYFVAPVTKPRNPRQSPRDREEHLRLQVSTGWNDAGTGFNFRISGLYGYQTVGFEYGLSAFSPTVGFRSARFEHWRCDDYRDNGALCHSHYQGELRSDAGAVKWIGKQPEPATQYLPQETKLIEYFQPVLDMLTAEMDAQLETGIDWFDAKHWYEHTPEEIAKMTSALNFNEKVEQERGAIKRLEIGWKFIFSLQAVGLSFLASPVAGGLWAAGTHLLASSWCLAMSEGVPARLLERCKKYPHLEWCVPSSQAP